MHFGKLLKDLKSKPVLGLQLQQQFYTLELLHSLQQLHLEKSQ